jgi:hypothetical protein
MSESDFLIRVKGFPPMTTAAARVLVHFYKMAWEREARLKWSAKTEQGFNTHNDTAKALFQDYQNLWDKIVRTRLRELQHERKS